ncbi:MAG: hypothetical protein ACI8ZN_002527 [Bacteroidia bacterium]
MKKTLKIIGILLLVLIVGFVGYLNISPDKHINGLYLIPADAMYILDSDDPIEDWNILSESDVWTFLKTHPVFAEITEDANYLDTLILDNSLIFKLFGSRKFLLSAHKTRSADYDFLFAVDLKNGAKTGILYPALEKLLQASDLTVTFRTYKDYEMMEVTDDVKDVLTLCKIENFLVCSYTPQLVEKSIDEWADPKLARDVYFNDVYKKVETKGIGRLYVHYDRVDDLMSCYMDGSNELISDLSKSLRFSALDINVEDNLWFLNGYTNVNTDVESYVLALMRSGQSAVQSPDVLSNRTAWYLSFNFSSIDQFYTQLRSVLSKDQSAFAAFEASQKKMENLLGISVKENLLDWVSDEVTLAQMRSNNYTSREDNLVVLMRAKDISNAKKNLDEVAKQVKKRTPAKFKQIDYRNYQIRFLDIKGFFRTFFGKAFTKMQKPFYCIIDNYVVWSNNPLTIIGLIEDYENNRVLSATKGYQNYAKHARSKSSLSIYVAPPNTYPLLQKYSKASKVNGLQKSKPYFDGFESFGLQLVEDDDFMRTYVVLTKTQIKEESDEVPEVEMVQKFEQYAAEISIDTTFVLQMVEDGIYKKFYLGGENLEIRAETKDGIMHGKYEEFYPTGNIKVDGKYRKGRKDGRWKYYTEEGDVDSKEHY